MYLKNNQNQNVFICYFSDDNALFFLLKTETDKQTPDNRTTHADVDTDKQPSHSTEIHCISYHMINCHVLWIAPLQYILMLGLI